MTARLLMASALGFSLIPGLMLGLAPGAQAAGPDNGYGFSGFGEVWRDGFGACVRSPYREAARYPACEPAPPEPVVEPVKVPPPPPPEPVTVKAVFESRALFDFDKATLRPEAKVKLDALVAQMDGVELSSVQVNGHTCSIGSDAYNQELSERRANAVAGYLQSQGVPTGLLNATGYGESKPAFSNETREGREKNRRVEVEMTGQKPR
ncbi:MAG: OmpA family protein [Gammaproteobacteria bacterium]